MEKPTIMAAVWGAPVSAGPIYVGRPRPNCAIQILFELIAAGLTAAKAYKHRKALVKSRLLWVLYRDAAIVFTVSGLVVCSGCELTRSQTILSIPSS